LADKPTSFSSVNGSDGRVVAGRQSEDGASAERAFEGSNQRIVTLKKDWQLDDGRGSSAGCEDAVEFVIVDGGESVVTEAQPGEAFDAVVIDGALDIIGAIEFVVGGIALEHVGPLTPAGFDEGIGEIDQCVDVGERIASSSAGEEIELTVNDTVPPNRRGGWRLGKVAVHRVQDDDRMVARGDVDRCASECTTGGADGDRGGGGCRHSRS